MICCLKEDARGCFMVTILEKNAALGKKGEANKQTSRTITGTSLACIDGGNVDMKLPLKDGDALIRTVVQEKWHVTVTDVQFIPVGDSAYSYRIEVRPDSSYYLKVVDLRSSTGKRTAAQMNFSLPLQHFITQSHLPVINAPQPQPTITGDLHAIQEPFLLALYTFIPGETLVDAYPMSSELTQRIGQTLATLHAIQLPDELQQRSSQDSLTAPFDTDLIADLALLEAISTHDAPFLQRLQKIVCPQSEQIRAFMAHSLEYAHKAQQTPVAAVICHGDAWGGNMILAPSGQLTLLDWESAVIAPPERDAFMYAGYHIGQDFAAFNAGYRIIHPEPMLWHTDWLNYYAYRIQLRNIAHWLHGLLHDPLDELQRDNDISMIDFHCLARWEHVERTARDLIALSTNGLC
jgi:spectinomycin phosphotransferase